MYPLTFPEDVWSLDRDVTSHDSSREYQVTEDTDVGWIFVSRPARPVRLQKSYSRIHYSLFTYSLFSPPMHKSLLK